MWKSYCVWKPSNTCTWRVHRSPKHQAAKQKPWAKTVVSFVLRFPSIITLHLNRKQNIETITVVAFDCTIYWWVHICVVEFQQLVPAARTWCPSPHILWPTSRPRQSRCWAPWAVVVGGQGWCIDKRAKVFIGFLSGENYIQVLVTVVYPYRIFFQVKRTHPEWLRKKTDVFQAFLFYIFLTKGFGRKWTKWVNVSWDL